MLSTRCVILLHDKKYFICSSSLDLICPNIILHFILFKAFNLCCGEAYARFSELKRLKVHPGNMTKERDAVSSVLDIFSVGTRRFFISNPLIFSSSVTCAMLRFICKTYTAK